MAKALESNTDFIPYCDFDRYADVAADRDAQQRAADAYGADPKHWARRVEIALEIVERALATESHRSTQK